MFVWKFVVPRADASHWLVASAMSWQNCVTSMLSASFNTLLRKTLLVAPGSMKRIRLNWLLGCCVLP
jgi:hypothetical protein